MSVAWIGLGTTAAVGIYGAIESKDAQLQAANTASSAAIKSSDAATRTQMEMFYTSLEQQEPFRQAGLDAITALTGRTFGGLTQDGGGQGGGGRDKGLIDQDIASTTQKLDQVNAMRAANETFLGRKGGAIKRDANFAHATAQVEKLSREGRELEKKLSGFNRELRGVERGVGVAEGQPFGGGFLGELRAQQENLGTENDEIFAFKQKQLADSLSARGITQSGAGIRSEVGLAAQEALRRQDLRSKLQTQRGNILMSLAGGGSSTASAQGTQATQVGGSLAELQIGKGQALADAATARGQATSSFYSGIGETVGQVSSLAMQNRTSTPTPTRAQPRSFSANILDTRRI